MCQRWEYPSKLNVWEAREGRHGTGPGLLDHLGASARHRGCSEPFCGSIHSPPMGWAFSSLSGVSRIGLTIFFLPTSASLSLEACFPSAQSLNLAVTFSCSMLFLLSHRSLTPASSSRRQFCSPFDVKALGDSPGSATYQLWPLSKFHFNVPICKPEIMLSLEVVVGTKQNIRCVWNV